MRLDFFFKNNKLSFTSSFSLSCGRRRIKKRLRRCGWYHTGLGTSQRLREDYQFDVFLDYEDSDGDKVRRRALRLGGFVGRVSRRAGA